jgi:hypothetical protein
VNISPTVAEPHLVARLVRRSGAIQAGCGLSQPSETVQTKYVHKGAEIRQAVDVCVQVGDVVCQVTSIRVRLLRCMSESKALKNRQRDEEQGKTYLQLVLEELANS